MCWSKRGTVTELAEQHRLYGFFGCYDLQKVVYQGSVEDFQMITKSSNWSGIRKDQLVTILCMNGEMDIHAV